MVFYSPKLLEMYLTYWSTNVMGYNMLFRDFYLETASEGLVTAKTASEGYFKAKKVPQTSI